MESITALFPGPPRPTLGDVARAAGVSAASASRALNRRGQSAATTGRVLSAADRLGYTPNAAARSLRLRRTQQIGLCVPDISNPVYSDLMRAVADVLERDGYRLVLHSTGGRRTRDEDVVRTVSDQHVDGLILVTLRGGARIAKAIEELHSTVVLVGESVPGARVDNVRVDSAAAARLAVEHLAGTGRHRIGFLGADPDSRAGAARLRGYRDGVQKAGLRLSSSYVADGDFSMTSGVEAAPGLARAGVDSLLCANDMVAIGALKALQLQGYDVPGDIAIVGIDDTLLGTLTTPSVSSVSLRTDERGSRAAQLLLERLKVPTKPVERVTFQPELVVRESS
jgi:LacI family transcriptional regulator, galactose operon repressor